jgi:hypothetical protein
MTMKRTEKRQERDKQTGRYIHIWGVIGSDERGEAAECQDCGKVQWYSRHEKPDRMFADREAARVAGAPMFQGY